MILGHSSIIGGGSFSGDVGIQQRILPAYRAAFFDRLARMCPGRLELFAGQPAAGEGIHTGVNLQAVQWRPARNLHFLRRNLYFCWQQGLITWLREFRPDVLVVEANPRLLSNYAGIRLMKAWGRPVIGWGLGILDWAAPKPVLSMRKHVLRRFYTCFDGLIAYSSKGAHDYQELGFPAENVFVAPNAVSNEEAERLFRRLDQDPRLIDEWKGTLGLSDKPVVLYVGRLIRQKRVGDLIEACSKISDACELLIVGDGPERPMLGALANRLLPKTRFLGHRTGEELALCFAAADLFVLPGPGGLAVQEAMSYGKPVIVASGDGTQADLIRDGKNGFHVPSGDIFAMARAIEVCIKDRTRFYQMGVESRRIVKDGHNLDAMVQTFIKALNFASTQGLRRA
jgi:glycosyltransferase involved in cell wall biosynthesis